MRNINYKVLARQQLNKSYRPLPVQEHDIVRRGELLRRLGLSQGRFIFYQRHGLMPYKKSDDSDIDHRFLYSVSEIKKILIQIDKLQLKGIPIQEIKERLDI